MSITYKELNPKKKEFALLMPTWNEGERIQNELRTIKEHNIHTMVDIFLIDGGTADRSIAQPFLEEMGGEVF